MIPIDNINFNHEFLLFISDPTNNIVCRDTYTEEVYPIKKIGINKYSLKRPKDEITFNLQQTSVSRLTWNVVIHLSDKGVNNRIYLTPTYKGYPLSLSLNYTDQMAYLYSIGIPLSSIIQEQLS